MLPEYYAKQPVYCAMLPGYCVTPPVYCATLREHCAMLRRYEMLPHYARRHVQPPRYALPHHHRGRHL
jgi:hypothetical protein